MPSKKIVYAGVGKTEDEIRFALKSKILMFNVESENELREIDRVAGKMKTKAPIALRINPDIDPGTHPYITTGMKKYKFGIPIEDALEYYRLASKLKNIDVIGVHKHIGSQITKVAPFVDDLKRVLILNAELRAQRVEIKYLDAGGRLGISYKDEEPPVPKDQRIALLPVVESEAKQLLKGVVSLLDIFCNTRSKEGAQETDKRNHEHKSHLCQPGRSHHQGLGSDDWGRYHRPPR